MYALVNNQELLLGPIGFNVRLINSELEDLELSYRIGPQDYTNVPISITSEVKLLPAVLNTPLYDGRFETLTSFEHEIQETQVVFTQYVSQKPLDQIKEERKAEVSIERKRLENTIINIDLEGEPVTVSTAKEERVFYATKLATASSDVYNFKFADNSWRSISSVQLAYVLNKIDEFVQELFDWELGKLQEIDACITKEDVYSVEIITPQLN